MKDAPALRWHDYTIAEKLVKAKNIADAMNGNPNFDKPNPELATVKAAIAALEQAEQVVLDNGGGTKWVKKRDTSVAVLDELITNLVKYVDNVANGDGNIILSAAIPLRKAPQPAGRLSAPQNLLARPMDTEGRVRVSWKLVKGRRAYKLQQSDVSEPFSWKDFDGNVVSETSLEIASLESGKKIWWRVTAINTKGEGDWSDPATCRVP